MSGTEARVGRLWMLPHDKPISVLMRILTLLHDWIVEYSYLDFFARAPMSEVGSHQNLELLNNIDEWID